MADFFTEPFWTESASAVRLPIVNGGNAETRWVIYLSSSTPTADGTVDFAGDYDISGLPWGTEVGGSVDIGPDDGEPSTADYVATLTANIGTETEALSTKETTLATAKAMERSKASILQEAEDARDAIIIQQIDATIDLQIATRRGNAGQIAAANESLEQATALLPPLYAAAETAYNANLTASAATITAQANVDNAKRQLARDTDFRDIAQLNLAVEDTSPIEAGDSRTRYGITQIDSGFSGLYFQSIPQSYSEEDDFGCIIATHYATRKCIGRYQVKATLSDAIYQGIKDKSPKIKFEWSEVLTETEFDTISVDPNPNPIPVTDPPYHSCPNYDRYSPSTAEPNVTVTKFTEEQALSEGTYDDARGEWYWVTDSKTPSISVGSAGTGAPGLPNQKLVVVGPPNVPTTGALIQYIGAERFRQGWQENITAQYADSAQRYLRLVVTGSTETPSGTSYSGMIAYEVPPDGYPTGYTPLPNDYFIGHPSDAKPLIAHVTLSADALRDLPAGILGGNGLVTDNNVSLTATVRTCAKPRGMILTLANEQKTSDISDAVDAKVAADWPAYNASTDSYAPTPRLRVEGALNCAPLTGDYVAKQKMRYKLAFAANDSRTVRTTPFSTTHKWELHHRDLITGIVTIEALQETVTWPQVTGTLIDPTYSYTKSEDEWREVDVPATNTSVSLVFIDGENADPHQFEGGPRVTIYEP